MASSLADGEQKAFTGAALSPPDARPRDWLEANRGQWILFVPVALGVGIALWFLLPFVAQRQAALLLALGVALAGLSTRGLMRRLVIGFGLLAAAGLLLADLRSQWVAPPTLNHRLSAAPLTGVVLSREARDGGDRTRLVLLRDASGTDPAHRVRLSFAGPVDAAIAPGARISVVAVLAPVGGPVLPGGYDGARAAWFAGISATGRATGPPQLLRAAQDGPARALLDRQRAALAGWLQAQIGGDAGGVAVALVVGSKGGISDARLEAFRISGMAHLLTVSGFHVATVVGATFFCLRWLLALWPWLVLRLSIRAIAAIGAASVGSLYALLAGGEVPALRAAIAAWVVMLALASGRDPLSLRLLAFAALLVLLVRPEALMSASFQLSFAAVGGLVLLAQSRLGRWLVARQPDQPWWARLGRYALALLATGIVAELLLSPIALAHFGRAGVYGVVANLAAIPLTSLVVMPLLALSMFLGLFGVSGLMLWLLRPAINALILIGDTVSAWPGASLAVPAVPGLAYGLGVVGALWLGLLLGRLRWLGAPLLAAGIALAIFLPRPDLLVSADGMQVAMVTGNGELATLRRTRGGFVPRMWAQASDAGIGPRFAELPGAACDATGCAVMVGPALRLLAFTGEGAGDVAARCAAADLVVAPFPLPPSCQPGWLLLDQNVLRPMGAVAIWSDRRTLDHVAARSGDHPWSPSALPGVQQTLLGGERWTGVIAE